MGGHSRARPESHLVVSLLLVGSWIGGSGGTVGATVADVGRSSQPPAAEHRELVEEGDRETVQLGVKRLGELPGIRTVQVWRDGREIVRRSFRGAGWGPWDIKSASKSILSLLVGIALDRGILGGLDRPIGELLPAEDLEGIELRKLEITLEDLLTMRSGLASTSGEHYGVWVTGRDWVRGALRRSLEHEPGSMFTYSTGNTHLISAILTRASGRSTRELLSDLLGEPLGIDVDGWERSPRGIYLGGNVFSLTPHELATVGRLVLNRGRWEGRTVVPSSWIERSCRRHADGWPDRYGAYGYLWWLPGDREDACLAVGYGGQFLYVDPGTDTVVVITSSHESKGAEWDRKVLEIIEERLLAPGPAKDEKARDGEESRQESHSRCA